MANPLIEISNLRKSYGRVEAIGGLTVSIARGQVTAVLGPNSSGKTTLMKSILGLVVPDQGEIKIDNQMIDSAGLYRKNIGYMPQIAPFLDMVTVKDLLSLMVGLREKQDLDQDLFHGFELQRYADRQLRELSGGTRQKVNAALAFMFDQPIVILDEPTVGLDPVSSIRLKEKIIKERERGKTVLLTSHVMSEVEELADDLLYLLEGKLFFHGSVSEIKARYAEQKLERAMAKLMLESSKTSEEQPHV